MSGAPDRQGRGTPTLPLRLHAKAFQAAIFDLDGVMTRTARVHAEAWKRLFDDFLRARSERTGEPFRPFDAAGDYLRYVDGKPRFEGVASFLESRGIELPWGEPGDGEDKLRSTASATARTGISTSISSARAWRSSNSSVRFLLALRAAGIRTALVSSSRNAAAVLGDGAASPACSTCTSTATTWRSWVSRESPRPTFSCLPRSGWARSRRALLCLRTRSAASRPGGPGASAS